MLFEHADARRFSNGLEHRAFDLATRRVSGVRDAPRGVSAFEMQIECGALQSGSAFFVAIESRAERLEHRDARGCVFDAKLYDALVTEARARDERVANVRFERIGVGENGGDAALRVLGVRFVGGAFGDDDHVTVFLRFERERQTCDPTSEDEEIAGLRHQRNGAT